jgi:hypothetical protein
MSRTVKFFLLTYGCYLLGFCMQYLNASAAFAVGFVTFTVMIAKHNKIINWVSKDPWDNQP